MIRVSGNRREMKTQADGIEGNTQERVGVKARGKKLLMDV